MQKLPLTLLAGVALAAPALAQLTLVAPPITATVEGNSNNVFPWGRTVAMRYQQIYDSTTFTTQSVIGPIVITRLRFRADSATGSWPGGTWPGPINVKMSTSPVDYRSFSLTFANNQGLNLATVFSGAVTKLPGTSNGAGVPSQWFIDIPLSSPFPYDPGQGDLTLDVEMDPTGFTGTVTTAADAEGSVNALCSRLWESTSATAATASGSAVDYGVVTQFEYSPAAGYATVSSYGTGCTTAATASFYENGPFDLSNTSLTFTSTGNGYLVLPGATTWHTPTTAPTTMGDDVVLPLALGWNFPYPGGTTTNLYISSNGFVGVSPTLANGCCVANVGTFLSSGPRWSALWDDLNPAVGGSVFFESDPITGRAYVTFDQVPEYGTTLLNTFQYVFDSAGGVVLRYQSCSISTALVGWSPGSSNLDPGPIDISATPVIITQPDQRAITHSVSARPVIGTTINLLTSNVPASAVLGANILGLTELNPGIDLTSFGMPGCRQYVSVDAPLFFTAVAGVGSTPFTIPNNPVGLVGVQIKVQGACLVPGINQLGALSSNGVRLTLDIN